jgi:hypothetical protein
MKGRGIDTTLGLLGLKFEPQDVASTALGLCHTRREQQHGRGAAGRVLARGQLRGRRAVSRTMIGHTVMRTASAAASQPATTAIPTARTTRAQQQRAALWSQRCGSTQSGGVPAQPAVVARRVRDGGHRSSVADRITTCHAIRSHPSPSRRRGSLPVNPADCSLRTVHERTRHQSNGAAVRAWVSAEGAFAGGRLRAGRIRGQGRVGLQRQHHGNLLTRLTVGAA